MSRSHGLGPGGGGRPGFKLPPNLLAVTSPSGQIRVASQGRGLLYVWVRLGITGMVELSESARRLCQCWPLENGWPLLLSSRGATLRVTLRKCRREGHLGPPRAWQLEPLMVPRVKTVFGLDRSRWRPAQVAPPRPQAQLAGGGSILVLPASSVRGTAASLSLASAADSECQ